MFRAKTLVRFLRNWKATCCNRISRQGNSTTPAAVALEDAESDIREDGRAKDTFDKIEKKRKERTIYVTRIVSCPFVMFMGGTVKCWVDVLRGLMKRVSLLASA